MLIDQIWSVLTHYGLSSSEGLDQLDCVEIKATQIMRTSEKHIEEKFEKQMLCL